MNCKYKKIFEWPKRLISDSFRYPVNKKILTLMYYATIFLSIAARAGAVR